jgi:hypothetical protein
MLRWSDDFFSIESLHLLESLNSLRVVECRVWKMMRCSVFGSVDIYYLSFRCRYVCFRSRELLSHRSTHTFAGSPKLILSHYDSFVHLSSVSSYTAHLGGKL